MDQTVKKWGVAASYAVAGVLFGANALLQSGSLALVWGVGAVIWVVSAGLRVNRIASQDSAG